MLTPLSKNRTNAHKVIKNPCGARVQAGRCTHDTADVMWNAHWVDFTRTDCVSALVRWNTTQIIMFKSSSTPSPAQLRVILLTSHLTDDEFELIPCNSTQAIVIKSSSLPAEVRVMPGLWRDSLHITCGLTACTPGPAPGPTLGNEYGKTLPLNFLVNRLPRIYNDKLKSPSLGFFCGWPWCM